MRAAAHAGGGLPFSVSIRLLAAPVLLLPLGSNHGNTHAGWQLNHGLAAGRRGRLLHRVRRLQSRSAQSKAVEALQGLGSSEQHPPPPPPPLAVAAAPHGCP